MTEQPVAPTPDTKDWTWVLAEPCPQCGFDSARVTGRDASRVLDDTVAVFTSALGNPDAAQRPAVDVWSPLEYAAHIRDVCAIFADRLRAMLAEDDPLFVNWDQDATAVEQQYWRQDRTQVAADVASNGAELADLFAHVGDNEWSRPGRRSNGSMFTVDSLARYLMHDLVHHCHDIGAASRSR